MSYVLEIYEDKGKNCEAELSSVVEARVERDLRGKHTLTFTVSLNDQGVQYIDNEDLVRLVDKDEDFLDNISAVDPLNLQISLSSRASEFDPKEVNSVSNGGNTSTTLNDDLQSWAPHEYRGGEIEITSGTGFGQKRTIYDNDSSSIELSAAEAWSTVPDDTSSYTLRKKKYILILTDPPFVARVLSVSGDTLTLDRMPENPSVGDAVRPVAFSTFRVVKKTVRRDPSGVPLMEVYCEHLSYDLLREWVVDVSGSPRLDYSNGIALSTLLNTVFSGSTWHVGLNELEKVEKPIVLDKESVRGAILEIAKVWGCDVLFNEDNSVDFLLEAGSRSGFFVRFGKTETSIEREVDSSRRKNTNFTYGASSEWINVGTGFYAKANHLEHDRFSASSYDLDVFRVGDILELCYGDVLNGTVTNYDQGTGEITDTNLSLTVDEYVGGILYITDGNNQGLMRRIKGNGANTILPYYKLDADPVGDKFFLAKKSFPGVVVTGKNSSQVLFQWKGGSLPKVPEGVVYAVLLVSLTGDLTIGKHPFFRSRASFDHTRTGTAASGSSTTQIVDSDGGFNDHGLGFWTDAHLQIAINSIQNDVLVASHTDTVLNLATPLSGDPRGLTYTLTQKKKVRVLSGHGSRFTVADCVFVGTTDQRTGEIAYISGIVGRNLELATELSEAPKRGDHVELLTATYVGPTFTRRGKFHDPNQRDPFKLYELSIKDVRENVNPLVSYGNVSVASIYEMDREAYKFEKVGIGDTITVQDELLGIESEEVRVVGITLFPFDFYRTTLKLSNYRSSLEYEVAEQARRIEKVESKIGEKEFPRCVNWDIDSGTCVLPNKNKTNNEGLICLDPDLSMMDGRRKKKRVPLTRNDCPAFRPFIAQEVRQKKTAVEGTVSGVDSEKWNDSNRFAVDVPFRVEDDSQAFVTGVFNETTSSAADLALAEARIQTVHYAPFNAASGVLAVGSAVTWDAGGSSGKVVVIEYHDSNNGVIGVTLQGGASPGSGDVITDGVNQVTLSANSSEKILPYDASKETGCYVQVRRSSGTDSLKVTAVALVVGYEVGN